MNDKPTQLNKTLAQMVGQRIDKVLQELGEELGLEIRYAGMSFSTLEANGKFKIKVTETADGGSVEEAKFAQNAFFYGLEPRDYKRKFRIHSGPNAGMYELVAIATRNHKYPFIAQRVGNPKARIKCTKNTLNFEDA